MSGVIRFDEMRAMLAGRNRFYSARLRSGVRFAELPFTTKQELVDDQGDHPPFGTNLTYPVEKYVRIHQTSGTAGKPILWLDTKESWDWWLRCWEQVFAGAGVKEADRVYVAFSFGPFIGFWAAFEAAQRIGTMVISGLRSRSHSPCMHTDLRAETGRYGAAARIRSQPRPGSHHRPCG